MMLKLKFQKWLKILVLFWLSLFVFNYLGLIVHEIGGHALTVKALGGKVKNIKVGSYWNLLKFKKSGTL